MSDSYGVATISLMLKNIGLLCKRALQKRPVFCKETCIFKHPTHRSHPICPTHMPICLIYMCDVSYSRVCHDYLLTCICMSSFTCVPSLPFDVHLYVIIHVCAITTFWYASVCHHSRVCHHYLLICICMSLFTCVPSLSSDVHLYFIIHVCAMIIFWYASVCHYSRVCHYYLLMCICISSFTCSRHFHRNRGQ